MIGLIQKLLLDMARERAGDDAVMEIKRRTGLPPDFNYRIDTDYDNTEAQRLLDNACAVLGISQDQAFEHYARHFLNAARHSFPTFFNLSPTARGLLARQPAIHNMLASGLRDTAKRDAVNDKFAISDLPGEPLEVRYRSPNAWCGLYFALTREVGEHYGENIDIDITQCRARGDNECVFRLHFTPKAPPA
ncbi:heme NO-binding domain-containing protein [Acidihalobacter ferrooxydans]|uniref:Heme NO-binding domain-containing protein n=1 Tax=Acidihalobacter ferrooxydans TaxID=1765967 RepID=A0A1P8UK42_9GAMM|nr:heme NO-binding domain-containing protein [Acidihalobacter ferrooxydans]APZ44200.1 hypothetical protein BW247_14810 [Acidihalobacter ferrooxydans]